MTINLTFTNPEDGTSAGSQTINTTLKVFFKKWEEWYWQAHPPKCPGPFPDSIANWFYFWRRIPQFQSQPYEAMCARTAGWWTPGGDTTMLGFYEPKHGCGDIYIVTYWSQKHDWYRGVLGTSPCCTLANAVRGIDAFAFVCRHENFHRTTFLEWWDDYEEGYLPRRATDDPDADYVPTTVEDSLGLDPGNKCSHPCQGETCGCHGSISDDWEYIIFKEHAQWDFGLWDSLDWAYPGKQTHPSY